MNMKCILRFITSIRNPVALFDHSDGKCDQNAHDSAFMRLSNESISQSGWLSGPRLDSFVVAQRCFYFCRGRFHGIQISISLAVVFLSICKYMSFLLWTWGASSRERKLEASVYFFDCRQLFCEPFFAILFILQAFILHIKKTESAALWLSCNRQLATNTIRTVKQGQNVWRYSSGTLQNSVFP